MAQPTFLKIYRRTVDVWNFVTDIYPEPDGADGYHGTDNGNGTVSFTDKNGTVKYNQIPYTAIEYIDEYSSNNYIPASAQALIIFLKAEGFFGEGSGGSGGSTTFIGLSDVSVPGGYAVNQDKIFIVSGSGLVPVTPSFAFQDNIGRYRAFNLAGTGEVSSLEVSDFINSGGIGAQVISEVQTPVIYAARRISDGITKSFIFLFTRGKGSYGLSGELTNQSDFRLLSIINLTPDQIIDEPNSFIISLGDTTGDNYWEVANLQDPPFDLTDSGELDENGNPKTYYFSYFDDGVLYYAQFVGTPGYYGVGANSFVESDFVDSTNDTITPAPNLQTVTDELNTTTNDIVIYGSEGKITYSKDNMTYTNLSGITTKTLYPNDQPTDVVFTHPIKDADDTYAMLSDISGVDGIDRRLLYTAISDTDTFSITLLIGATSIQMIASTVAGNVMSSEITFNSATGEISGYPVLTGEEHLIFYTKP